MTRARILADYVSSGDELALKAPITNAALVTPNLGTPSAGVMTNMTGAVEASLVDNAVTLAKMAGGTDGNLITYDTSGDPAYVATGTSGHVLTSAGADAVPAFAAIPAASVWTKIGSASFSAASTLELGQTLGTYKRHKLFITIGNDAGDNATTHYHMQVEIGGSYLAGGAYHGSRWWSQGAATAVSCDALNDLDQYIFSPSEGAPFLNGSGATNISAFASYEFTFSNFTQSGTDNWSQLWYSGIGANHDAGNPCFTTRGSCMIMNTGAVTDVKIWPTSNRSIKGNWELYGIS